ncbi:PHD finger protein 8, partial [Xenoophorus captivus]
AKPCSDPNRIREPGEVDFDIEEDYTTDEEALAAHGVKGGAGGILDLLKASKQVAGLDSAALRFVDLSVDWFIKIVFCFYGCLQHESG